MSVCAGAVEKAADTEKTAETAQAKDIRANQYLQKMTPADDVEAFLATFERTATREAWPRESWAGLVAPFLIGEAQKAYYDLEPAAAQDFNKLKAEILARLGVTIAVRAQRVHQWTYNVGKPPRSQMFDLVHLTRKWLQPEVLSAPDVVQRVVMDRYLRALPPALRKWVSHGDPKSADQLVDLVERIKITGKGICIKSSHLNWTKSLSKEELTRVRVSANTGKCLGDCGMWTDPIIASLAYLSV
ncbi:SCAN domain-containing protein 3-like [Gastrophryne carolinensis]